MPLSRQTVLSLVAEANKAGQDFVTVPQSLWSKANALVRQGYLIEGIEPGTYRASQIGMLMARDMEEME